MAVAVTSDYGFTHAEGTVAEILAQLETDEVKAKNIISFYYNAGDSKHCVVYKEG